jgi:two-component system, OmpR family, response regulator MprA
VAPRILAVDDDPKMLSLMRRGLIFADYAVDLAADGEEALAIARDRPPDLVVLDVMLPGIDGLAVCKRLRAADPHVPILLLTARGRVPDRVAGLDAGADDYLIKPFAFDELLARIRALLRRTEVADQSQHLRFGDLSVDLASHDVVRGHRALELTTREYELLVYFMRHPRQVLSRDQILEHVWNDEPLGESNVVDVHVMRLRHKLEAADEPRLLWTLRGAGYSLRET